MGRKGITNSFSHYTVSQGVTVEAGEYHFMADAIRIIEEGTRRCLFHGGE